MNKITRDERTGAVMVSVETDPGFRRIAPSLRNPEAIDDALGKLDDLERIFSRLESGELPEDQDKDTGDQAMRDTLDELAMIAGAAAAGTVKEAAAIGTMKESVTAGDPAEVEAAAVGTVKDTGDGAICFRTQDIAETLENVRASGSLPGGARGSSTHGGSAFDGDTPGEAREISGRPGDEVDWQDGPGPEDEDLDEFTGELTYDPDEPDEDMTGGESGSARPALRDLLGRAAISVDDPAMPEPGPVRPDRRERFTEAADRDEKVLSRMETAEPDPGNNAVRAWARGVVEDHFPRKESPGGDLASFGADRDAGIPDWARDTGMADPGRDGIPGWARAPETTMRDARGTGDGYVADIEFDMPGPGPDPEGSPVTNDDTPTAAAAPAMAGAAAAGAAVIPLAAVRASGLDAVPVRGATPGIPNGPPVVKGVMPDAPAPAAESGDAAADSDIMGLESQDGNPETTGKPRRPLLRTILMGTAVAAVAGAAIFSAVTLLAPTAPVAPVTSIAPPAELVAQGGTAEAPSGTGVDREDRLAAADPEDRPTAVQPEGGGSAPADDLADLRALGDMPPPSAPAVEEGGDRISDIARGLISEDIDLRDLFLDLPEPEPVAIPGDRLPAAEPVATVSLEVFEALSQSFEALAANVDVLFEGIEARDAQIAELAAALDRVLETASRAETLVIAQNEVLVRFVAAEEKLEMAEHLIVDLSQRLANIEGVEIADRNDIEDRLRRIDERLNGLTTDLGMVARVIVNGAPGRVTSRALGNAVFDRGRADLRSPAAQPDQVPATVQVGDFVNGYGTVLEIFQTSDGGRMVVMENGTVIQN